MFCKPLPACWLQVRSIIGQVRPARQTLLFSATMPQKVDRLVRDALTSPVRITVGEVGAANEDIRQVCQSVLHCFCGGKHAEAVQNSGGMADSVVAVACLVWMRACFRLLRASLPLK